MNIVDFLRIRKAEGDVGIEIECEGENLGMVGTQYWRTEHDGSLRGHFPESCAEYILKKPIMIGDVPAAMQDFHEHLPDAKFNFSFRTSTHVHVNVQQLEYPQLLAMMYTYLLIEEPLMNFCGKTRKGNRFCLRLADAEGLDVVLNQMFYKGIDSLKGIPNDVYRYAAMNIDAIRKYGSLEFRGMRGTADAETINIWCKALVALREFGKKIGEPNEVFELYAHLGPNDFFHKVLGDVAKEFYYGRLIADIQKSFSLTLDLPYAYGAGCRAKEAPKPPVKEWHDENIDEELFN